MLNIKSNELLRGRLTIQRLSQSLLGYTSLPQTPTSTWNSVYTFLTFWPDRRQRGRLRNPHGRDIHRPKVCRMCLADLLRGKPGPRGLEFWRLVTFILDVGVLGRLALTEKQLAIDDSECRRMWKMRWKDEISM